MIFAAYQRGKTVNFLIGCTGSDWVDVGDRRGDTALHATCCNDSIEVMEFLLQSEANPNVANVEGLTPAHLARSSRALELLYSYNAELHCIDNKYVYCRTWNWSGSIFPYLYT